MNVCRLAERAAVAFLATKTFTGIPAAQIYHGIEHRADTMENKDASIRKLPCIVVTCTGLTSTRTFSGNWRGNLRFTLISHAKDTSADDHETRTKELYDQVITDTIAADLAGAIANFDCSLALPAAQGYAIVGDRWESFIELVITCCPTDLG